MEYKVYLRITQGLRIPHVRWACEGVVSESDCCVNEIR